jgi:hypothetical protein
MRTPQTSTSRRPSRTRLSGAFTRRVVSGAGVGGDVDRERDDLRRTGVERDAHLLLAARERDPVAGVGDRGIRVEQPVGAVLGVVGVGREHLHGLRCRARVAHEVGVFEVLTRGCLVAET